MGTQKSKWPSFQEIISMLGTLGRSVARGVKQVVADYQKEHGKSASTCSHQKKSVCSEKTVKESVKDPSSSSPASAKKKVTRAKPPKANEPEHKEVDLKSENKS